MAHFIHLASLLLGIADKAEFDWAVSSEAERQVRELIRLGRAKLIEGNYSAADTNFGAALRFDPEVLHRAFKQKDELETILRDVESTLLVEPRLPNTRDLVEFFRGPTFEAHSK